ANARMLGMSERQLMRHVYWPSALSWMFSSLHTSVGFAVVGAVVGEYLGSAAGLGYLIQQAEGVFDVAGVFAGMFVLAVFVLAFGLLASHPAQAQAVEKPGVTLAVGGKSGLCYLPLTITERLGYFKEQGLDVSINDFAGGAKSLQALLGGSVDVVTGAYEHTVRMQARGQDVKAVLELGRFPGFVLGVRKER